jgi:hypothetical protein
LKWKNVNRARPQNERLPDEALSAIVERNKWDLELYAFAEEQLLRQIEADANKFGPELSMVQQLLDDEAEA